METSKKQLNIRVLHLVKSLDIGGVEKSTILYCNELSKMYNFVGIFASRGFFDNYSIISPKVARFFPKRDISNLFYFHINLLSLLKIVKREKLTHIHYHQRIFTIFILPIKFLCKIKVVYSHQNVFNDVLNRIIIADKIIALTIFTKLDLPKIYHSRTYVIPHGIVIPQNIIKEHKDVFTFAFIGRFVKWKGIIELIDEFAKLKCSNNNIELYIIGEGEMLKEIETKILFLKLKKFIKIIPSQIDLTAYYQKIDVLVLPSTKLEGFGIVLIEAMSFGIPVIVKDNPVFEDVVINDVNGIVEKGSLFKSMSKLLLNNELYKKLSSGALKSSKIYEIKNIIDQYTKQIY